MQMGFYLLSGIRKDIAAGANCDYTVKRYANKKSNSIDLADRIVLPLLVLKAVRHESSPIAS